MRHPERGSVTIVVAGVLAATIVLAMGAADVARVYLVAAQAQTAADAAALAAAQELAVPSGTDPEDVASGFAERNGGDLVACECSSDATEAVVEVRVAVGPLLLFADDRVVVAEARGVVDLPSA